MDGSFDTSNILTFNKRTCYLWRVHKFTSTDDTSGHTEISSDNVCSSARSLVDLTLKITLDCEYGGRHLSVMASIPLYEPSHRQIAIASYLTIPELRAVS